MSSNCRNLPCALVLTLPVEASAADWDDLTKQEAARITPFANRVRRDGHTLRPALRDGREAKPTNPPGYCAGPEGCTVYSFERHLAAANSYVIEVSYYEEGEYMAIDSRTGTEAKIGAVPHIDPPGTRFIAVGAGEMEVNLNGFEMSPLTPDGPQMEWRYETTEHFLAHGIVLQNRVGARVRPMFHVKHLCVKTLTPPCGGRRGRGSGRGRGRACRRRR